jgi:hypothetical protein
MTEMQKRVFGNVMLLLGMLFALGVAFSAFVTGDAGTALIRTLASIAFLTAGVLIKRGAYGAKKEEK